MNSILFYLRNTGDYLFPRECVVCGRTGGWLCAVCQDQIPLLIPACPVCRKETMGGRTHMPCANDLAFQGCLPAVSLSLSPVAQLVYGCKYHGLRSAAHALAYLIERAVAASPPLSEWIRAARPLLTPIPLHIQQERARGFNQAGYIADALAISLNLPRQRLLTRVRMTADQVKLTREERKKNCAGAFSIADCITTLPPAVILVDDVVTTGATFDAAARTLKGMRKDIAIWGLAAAYHNTLPS